MSALDALEARLRCLDLRFAAPEPARHVEDERIAAIASGAEPSEAEAAHLAACDACVDVLVAAGEGLESLPSEVDLTAPRPARPVDVMPGGAPSAGAGRGGVRLRSGWVVAGLALACAAAAAAAIGGALFPSPGALVPEEAVADAVGAPAAAPSPTTSVPTQPPPAAESAMGSAPPPAAVAVEPTAPQPPVRSLGRPVAVSSAPSAPSGRPAAGESAPRPGAVAAAIGEIEEREPEAFGRAPVHAPGRGFGFLRLTATPPAQVFIGERPYG